jgi:hypothetical protein
VVSRNLVLVAAIGVIAGLGFGGGLLVLRGPNAPTGDLRHAFVPCAQQDSAVLATLGRVPAGVSRPTLVGLTVLPALGADPGLVAILNHAGQPADQSNVPDSIFSRLGSLRAQASTPTMRSCHLHLADSPAASAMATRAIKALVAAGMVTETHAAADTSVYFVAEDPTAAGVYLFTLVQPGLAALGVELEPDGSALVGPAGWYNP